MRDPATFDAFYSGSVQRLTGQLYAMTGSRAEAEDCVQEAYARAWQRWDKVSGYCDPEAWVRTVAYRSRTVREPRTVLAEFGLELPGEVEITVWDSTSEARYMVLPVRPAGTEALGAHELTALVTRNGLIGTALV